MKILCFAGAELDGWVSKYGWTSRGENIFIANQEENVKTKKITEKIAFESTYNESLRFGR